MAYRILNADSVTSWVIDSVLLPVINRVIIPVFDSVIFCKEKNEGIVCTMNHIDSSLYDAVVKDNIDHLKSLKIGNHLTPTNNTLLHLACQYGSINCVKEILRVHKSLLLNINSRGETALHLAARGGHYQVVVELINVAKSFGRATFRVLIIKNMITTFYSPTSQEFIFGTQPIPSTMLQFFIRTTNVEYETALHAAVRYNRRNVVQLLITEDPTHIHPQNNHAQTPLYLASIRYNTDIIKIILHNCKCPMFGGPEGRTALHAAVLEDDNKGYGTPNNLRDVKFKRTALHIAAYKGNVRVLEELLKYSPDCWDIVDTSDQNIMHIAVKQNQKEVVRFILSQGCDASNNLLIQRDEDGNIPLHLIAKTGCYVKELMDLETLDWEVLNNKKLTPLDVLHREDETCTLNDQAMVKTTLVNANVKKHWHLWRTLKNPDIETGNNVLKNEKNSLEIEEYKKMIGTHMIVAALIATVALTAGFAMPGGFDGNQGPNQGSPVLIKRTAFKAFIIADAIALFLSISSLSLYFVTTICKDVRVVRKWFSTSVKLNVGSIIAMMTAFIAGTYSVLDHSVKLAISFCVISSTALLLIYFVISRIIETLVTD